MAIVINGLFSLNAWGSVGLLTFSEHQAKSFGKQVVRKKPNSGKSARSVDQNLRIEMFSNACNAWKLLQPNERVWWSSHGSRIDLTGRNWFISEYLIQWIKPPNFPLQPDPLVTL